MAVVAKIQLNAATPLLSQQRVARELSHVSDPLCGGRVQHLRCGLSNNCLQPCR